jgi:hypothetical protein
MDINVYNYQTTDEELHDKIDRILTLLRRQGANMSQLSDAVDALQGRISEDVSHLLDLLSAANARAEASAANDAADAATIADLQAQNQAAMDDAAATVARITAIDPVADFPGVETPPEEPPVEPSVETPNGEGV